MLYHYNNNKEQLYREFVEAEARKGCRTLTLLAVFLFPAFSVLDYLTHNEHFVVLSYIRFSTSFIFFCMHFLFKSGRGLGKPFITGPVLLAIASLSITSMCMVLTGSESPYYAGVNLVVLAGVLILPSHGFHSALSITIVIGIYILGIIGREGLVPAYPEVFINNMYFLVSTGVIGVTASALHDEVRKEAFYSNLEIQRSMEVLQNELKGDTGNIEKLAQDLVVKKGEVQSSLELRDQFISMASHELLSPLTALKLQLEIGRRKLEHPMEINQMQGIIASADSQIEKVIQIVNEMLDVSRIQSGKFTIEKKEQSLNNLINQILSRYFEQHLSQGKIIFEGPKESIIGNWDAFKLEQVILNLIKNALNYGGESEIKINISTNSQEAILSVEDKGMGIDPKDHARIFEKYERTTQKFGGLGMGLYIANQIVESHGGSIELESTPGKGSKFIVHLPLT